jgi:hypothetical protein
VIASVAGLGPGAVVDVAERTVAWTSPANESTVFGYGGCVDIGSTVARSTPMRAPRTREQVFAVARELAKRFWSPDPVGADLAANALIAGLDDSTFAIATQDRRTTYSVADPSYVQLHVEHEFVDGVDRVTIVWQGNF